MTERCRFLIRRILLSTHSIHTDVVGVITHSSVAGIETFPIDSITDFFVITTVIVFTVKQVGRASGSPQSIDPVYLKMNVMFSTQETVHFKIQTYPFLKAIVVARKTIKLTFASENSG